ncbi:MAG: oxidoreductase [Flavobacteriaceae bacterium]|nr:oxidoreductase [Flavobacteriaceae bacterium]
MQLLTPAHWKDYELLDCGNFMKLERFGQYVLIRPEPQAVWEPVMNTKEWQQQAHAEFMQKGSYSGEWKQLKPTNKNWEIAYKNAGMNIRFKLSLTGFKHVGVFPEQAVNWDFIYETMKKAAEGSAEKPSFLNLFAYTGGASLAAKAAGADTVHVDSVKQVVSWARENMELSNLDNIRWTVEDALKFVKREVKRGKKYHGIAMDPPAYGIGANGERWKLEEQINELIAETAQLLHEQNACYILNCYSLGFSSLVVANLLDRHFPNHQNKNHGEIFLKSRTNLNLPLGVVGRIG